MAKKRLFDEHGNEVKGKIKKPFYKKIWFWVVAVLLLAIIGGSLGGEDTASTTNNDSGKDTDKKSSKEEKKENDTNLKEEYDAIAIGDLMGSDEGTPYDAVVDKFGEPETTSDSELEGIVTKLAVWGDLDGGDMLSSLSVSFNDNLAVSKAISGLPVEKSDKATLEQFNAVSTDGSYSYEQAVETFGEPDGFSETLINGSEQNMAMWTANVQGEMGSNFNISFEDGMATGKSQFSME